MWPTLYMNDLFKDSDNKLCLRVSDKHIILSWCTAVSVTFWFCFAQARTVPFRATETLGLAELLRLINWDVLKRG